MYSGSLLFAIIACLLIGDRCASSQNAPIVKRIRECLGRTEPTLCLKEEALDVLNQTISSENPINIYEGIDIEKDPNYLSNSIDADLPAETNERNFKLNELIYRKVEEFFESRTLKFSLSNVFEGRKKKDKMGGMMMMGGLAMACMMGQMFMGKIAFLAGTALLVAKMALMLSAISGLKKMGGNGGGGEAQHIVYTSSDGGHSHGGGGGWHRSLNYGDGPSLAYGGHIPTEATYSR